jgi:hypothetical protein
MTDGFDVRVLDGLNKAYTIEELRDLCFRLGVDDEQLEQRTKGQLARGLIGYMGRRGRLNELIDLLRAERPHVPWPDPPRRM